MQMLTKAAGLRQREERRQVFLRARMRAGGQPADICIRNISSRGMLLQTAAPPPRGSYVEVLLPMHRIVARVVWVKERRFGVQTREAMDLDNILGVPGSRGTAGALSASAVAIPKPKGNALTIAQIRERHERSRRVSALFQFIFMAICGAAIAIVAAQTIYARLDATAGEVANRL